MKSAIFALVTVVSMIASAEYKTVVLYDGGESGTEKRVVTYKVRPASAPIEVSCQVPAGEAGYQPCPTKTSTGLLRDVEKVFKALGIHGSAPGIDANGNLIDDNAPGGN